jgi:UDP-glucose 4-epimerase
MADPARAYEGRTVLVTGGAGAIGSNLTRALAEAGARVLILDDLSASARWNVPSLPGVLFVEGDLLDEGLLKRLFLERPSVVFHLAAFFANQNSVDHPEADLRVNGQGTLRLMEYASLAGVDRFVYASSGCSVYGSRAPLPHTEDFVSLHLTTPYQVTKMLGEAYANFFHHHHGLPVAIPRLFNCYGPGQIPGQYRDVIPNFLYWAMKGQPLPLTGTGDETRDFTFIGDVIRGLLLAGTEEAAVGEAFNLASGRETRIADLATEINGITGNDAGTVHAEVRRWDVKKRVLASVDKADALLRWQPETDLRAGLERSAAWFREHWDDIEASARFGPGVSSAVREMTADE